MVHEPEHVAFSALGQPLRLRAYSLVARAGAGGIGAGAIARSLGVAPAGLTAHLSILVRAGLLARRDQGRTATFVVDVGAAARLGRWLADIVDSARAGPSE